MASKSEQLKEKIERDKKIKQEINKFKKIYKNLNKEKFKTIEGLISDAAFLKITLCDLKEDMLQNGLTELFEQGEQSFNRERPEVKTYATFLQRYTGVMKQLIELMPPEEKKIEKDQLNEFQNKMAKKRLGQ